MPRLTPPMTRSHPDLGRPVRPFVLAGLALTGLALASLASLGCSGATATCDMLNASVSPSGPQQLAVGQSLTARLTYTGGCAGGARTRLTDTITWTARDTTVVRVEAATGLITGRAPGSTVVVGQGTSNHLGAQIAVTVY